MSVLPLHWVKRPSITVMRRRRRMPEVETRVSQVLEVVVRSRSRVDLRGRLDEPLCACVRPWCRSSMLDEEGET